MMIGKLEREFFPVVGKYVAAILMYYDGLYAYNIIATFIRDQRRNFLRSRGIYNWSDSIPRKLCRRDTISERRNFLRHVYNNIDLSSGTVRSVGE